MEEYPILKVHGTRPCSAVGIPASTVLVHKPADSLAEPLARVEADITIVLTSTVLDLHLLGPEGDLEQRTPKQEGARERTKVGKSTTALMMRWQEGLLEVLVEDPPRV